MRDVSLADLLDVALEVARRAGSTTVEHFQTELEVEIKDDGSPVTVADRAAEATAREVIEKQFPTDGIIGEELGALRPDAARRWILDPIDGTLSFVRGVPLYGVLVAVEEGDDAVVGVLHFPALQETVGAARGEGCWWNDGRARVSEISKTDEALVLCTCAEDMKAYGRADGWRRLGGRVAMVRTWGDCYGHALVATGRAEAMFDPVLARWDAAALVPVIEEAGGVYTDWSGRPTQLSDSGISTNRALAGALREIAGAALPLQTS